MKERNIKHMIKKYTLEVTGEERLPHLVEEGVYSVVEDTLSDSHEVAVFSRDILKLSSKAEEYVFAIYLNTKGRILGVSEVAHGGINSASISISSAFIRGLLLNAVNMIIVHNHPSTCVSPSMEDEALTRRLYETGELVSIHLLDAIIIGDYDNYYSFRESQKEIFHE